MDSIVDAVLWLIAGGSFVFVVIGCWMTKPAMPIEISRTSM
jgi:hypothetical protein